MASSWQGLAEAYDATTGRLCAGAHDALVSLLEPVLDPGTPPHVLDVGCGTGTLTARLVERGARVTALDPDPSMVDATRLRAPGAEVRLGALPHLPVPDGSIDAAVGAFVVNHLADPRAGVGALARSLRPGGLLAATIWPAEGMTIPRLWADVLADVGVAPAAATRLPADLDFDRTPSGLASLLTGAGLDEVDARELAWTFDAEPDLLWCSAAAGIGGIGATVLAQPDAVRSRLHDAYHARVARHVVDGRLRMPVTAVLGLGVSPRATPADRRG